MQMHPSFGGGYNQNSIRSLHMLQATSLRDQNISGIAVESTYAALNLVPVYGSKASFKSKTFQYEVDDHQINMMPFSMNSLEAQYEVRYDLNESNARKLAAFIESKNGTQMF